VLEADDLPGHLREVPLLREPFDHNRRSDLTDPDNQSRVEPSAGEVDEHSDIVAGAAVFVPVSRGSCQPPSVRWTTRSKSIVADRRTETTG
jgi:hypothetical protein